MDIQTIEKDGQIFAVLPMDAYEKLLDDAEMLDDIRAFDEAIARNEPAFPLDIWEAIEAGVGSGIAALRRCRGMTQQELVMKTGIKQSYISDIEHGKKQGSIVTLKLIANALEVPLDALC